MIPLIKNAIEATLENEIETHLDDTYPHNLLTLDLKRNGLCTVRAWAETISQLDIYFEERLNVGL